MLTILSSLSLELFFWLKWFKLVFTLLIPIIYIWYLNFIIFIKQNSKDDDIANM